MNHERLHSRLADVETLLADMADLLVRGDAPSFETAATALRQAMVELAHASQRADGPPPHADLRERLQRVAHALVRQRENLARRSVINERGLAAVLPQHRATYTAPGRQGPFRGSVARLYVTPAT
ncbi:hypothetical protein [Pseudorhodoferax sp. Leaf267]|uniref:hypothetical protein n=1 Tax=Pseudorhodoferax sp. Leaf267 TaxID=1736316 RepID=UPI0007012856|nr:hypothetical protein [Pseudorhodoferax sp. Leaf267]KQP13758.1 hypothetical protein ASF43_17885 [Pseudorhodoferax sp. Leaf267]